MHVQPMLSSDNMTLWLLVLLKLHRIWPLPSALLKKVFPGDNARQSTVVTEHAVTLHEAKSLRNLLTVRVAFTKLAEIAKQLHQFC